MTSYRCACGLVTRDRWTAFFHLLRVVRWGRHEGGPPLRQGVRKAARRP